MRTIRIEMIDREMSLPVENPVILRATEDANFTFGDIRYIKTGIRFYLPADIEKIFLSRVSGVVVLGCQQNDMDGDFQLVVLCCSMSARIGRMQPVASMKLFEMKPTSLRFSSYSDEGKRLIFGGRKEVENHSDIQNPKP